jgi:hypothetical protein
MATTTNKSSHSLNTMKTQGGEYSSPAKPAKKQKSTSSTRKVKDKVKDKVASLGAAVRVKQSKAAKQSTVPSPLHDTDCDSDEYNFSEAESAAGEIPTFAAVPSAAVSVGSVSLTGSKRVPLPCNLQVQLLIDILAAGGIDLYNVDSSHALATLCDHHPDLYGQRKDPLRDRIARKSMVGRIRRRILLQSGWLL